MKLILALLLNSLPAALASSVSLRGAFQEALRSTTGGDFSLGVNASFILDTGDDLTTEEEAFLEYSVRRAYNSVHDPNTLMMKFVNMVDVTNTPVPGTTERDTPSLKGKYQPFNWASGYYTLGNCRLCRSGLKGRSDARFALTPAAVALEEFQLGQTRVSWELTLCDKLRNGLFTTFQSVSNCSIGIFLPETGDYSGAQDVQMSVTSQFTSPYNQDLSTNEQLFANECLRLAYNEVHDPAVAFMVTTNLVNQTYIVAAHAITDKTGAITQGSLSWTLEWDVEASFLNVSTYDDDASGNFTLRASTFGFNIEQQHNRWQTTFCDKLRSGPFSAFQSVENCQIVVSDATPAFAVHTPEVAV